MEFLDKIHRTISDKLLTAKVANALENAVNQTGEQARKQWEMAASEAERDGSQQALERLETESLKILLDLHRGQVKIATAASLAMVQAATALAQLGLLPEDETREENNKALSMLDSVVDHQIDSLLTLEKAINLPSRDWLSKNLYNAVYQFAEVREIMTPAAVQAADIIKRYAQEKIASLSERSKT